MPALPTNGLYRCPSCAILYLDPPVLSRETWKDKILGPWVEYPCVHCGGQGLQILGKVKLKPLTRDETPTRNRALTLNR